MISFSEFLEEKIKNMIDSNWHILQLDDGTELQANMKLISLNKIIIAKQDDRTSKEYKLNTKNSIIEQIEKIINQKLNIKDSKVKKFIELYPCPCEVK